MLRALMILLTSSIFLAGCNSKKPQPESLEETAVTVTPLAEPDEEVKDSLVRRYIRTTKNEIIVDLRNDTASPISFIYQEMEERDGRTYTAVQIGTSFESHFATAAWLLIDSATNQLYELDMANDSLVEYK